MGGSSAETRAGGFSAPQAFALFPHSVHCSECYCANERVYEFDDLWRDLHGLCLWEKLQTLLKMKTSSWWPQAARIFQFASSLRSCQGADLKNFCKEKFCKLFQSHNLLFLFLKCFLSRDWSETEQNFCLVVKHGRGRWKERKRGSRSFALPKDWETWSTDTKKKRTIFPQTSSTRHDLRDRSCLEHKLSESSVLYWPHSYIAPLKYFPK